MFEPDDTGRRAVELDMQLAAIRSEIQARDAVNMCSMLAALVFMLMLVRMLSLRIQGPRSEHHSSNEPSQWFIQPAKAHNAP